MTGMTASSTLVFIPALVSLVHHTSGWTRALEAAHSVCTLSSVTQPRYSLTLVDVHAFAGVDVLEEARLTVKARRTPRTRMTPGYTWGKQW